MLDVAVSERERRRDRLQVVSDFEGRPLRRFAGFAVAMASLILLVVSFGHLTSVNSELQRRLAQKFQAAAALERRLAEKDKQIVAEKEDRIAAEKAKQIAVANDRAHRLQAQRLQAQLNAIKSHPSGPRLEAFTHGENGGNGSVVSHGGHHTNPDKVAQNIPEKKLASPLDRAVQIASSEEHLPLSADYQKDMIGV